MLHRIKIKKYKIMSRIGKKEIDIPKDVQIILDKNVLCINGPLGVNISEIHSNILLEISGNKIKVKRIDESKKSKALHGLFRSIIQNMIIGVTTKFTKILIAEGVGYKFQINNNKLYLNMGYSHPIEYIIPDNLAINCESATRLVISSGNKELVGRFASKIRRVRPPEPYKGKGIRYESETILRKIGKTGK